ncbi:hypothetical protein DWX10_16995 [Clostridium sp. AF18-27]|uniref:hypothetical protein n=1 Tax=Enterocloster lavalensis TaxID=460384 RepID=UPI000E50C0E8|nr:hypothetical protein [Enterocloster lavalensis]RHR52108.1 hypothetical protein DWX10_16995 [Clostridium sp. AF18-27]
MTEQEIFQMIKSIGLPVAYHHFEEGQSPDPPFLVYLYPGTNHFSADGTVYQGVNQLDIELYTDKKDLEAEKRVEAVLKEHGLFYEKTETYLESEKMYEVLFETEVLINEQS